MGAIKRVVLIKRGLYAGKFRAEIVTDGRVHTNGRWDTEEEAWISFDFNHTLSFAKTQSKSKKIDLNDWNRISKEQVKYLSQQYG